MQKRNVQLKGMKKEDVEHSKYSGMSWVNAENGDRSLYEV